MRFDKEIFDRVVAQIGPQIEIGDGVDEFERRAARFAVERNHRSEADEGGSQKSKGAEERQHSGKAKTCIVEEPDHRVDGGKSMMTFLEEKMARWPSSRSQQLKDDCEIVALTQKGVTEQPVGRAADDMPGAARHVDHERLSLFPPAGCCVCRKSRRQG